ncbi:unnamed protein product [Darwinula stevensoni]|uniref:Uncharacterized protein n=1 Tax=Darwinula stevensoni TaxID=69355 RepID=A0A7R9A296_9CRUS|nr:unnamed protein product [Darwinula stevensoni]CAG0889237.1 unnamed protein product [Darwinula stevensoni]
MTLIESSSTSAFYLLAILFGILVCTIPSAEGSVYGTDDRGEKGGQAQGAVMETERICLSYPVFKELMMRALSLKSETISSQNAAKRPVKRLLGMDLTDMIAHQGDMGQRFEDLIKIMEYKGKK